MFKWFFRDTENLSTSRVEALCDGVFAIAMTIVIFELKIPDGLSTGDLWSYINDNVHKLENYAISFIILATYWLKHQLQFRYIKTADKQLLWVNIFFMMFIALIPFSTGMVMNYPDETLAFVVYGVNLSIPGYILYYQWIYATKNYRLISNDLGTDAIVKAEKIILVAPLIFTASIILSFFSVRLALLSLYCEPIFYVFFEWSRTRTKKKNNAGEAYKLDKDSILSKGRIETLTDGIFAIVMTLIILDLKVPPALSPKIASIELPIQLYTLLPKLENYLISFIVLGVFWMRHQQQLNYFVYSTRSLLWINVLFLMFVGLVPFTTGFLMAYPEGKISLSAYILNLDLIALILYLQWQYASHKHRLISGDLSKEIIQLNSRMTLTWAIVFLVALGFVYINPRIGLNMLYIVPLTYILAKKYGRVRKKRQDKKLKQSK